MSQDNTLPETFYVQGSKIRQFVPFSIAYAIGGLFMSVFLNDTEDYLYWLIGSLVGILIATWIVPECKFSADSEKIVGPPFWGWNNVEIPVEEVKEININNRTFWDKLNRTYRIQDINGKTFTVNLSHFSSEQRANIIQFLSELSVKR